MKKTRLYYPLFAVLLLATSCAVSQPAALPTAISTTVPSATTDNGRVGKVISQVFWGETPNPDSVELLIRLDQAEAWTDINLGVGKGGNGWYEANNLDTAHIQKGKVLRQGSTLLLEPSFEGIKSLTINGVLQSPRFMFLRPGNHWLGAPEHNGESGVYLWDYATYDMTGVYVTSLGEDSFEIRTYSPERKKTISIRKGEKVTLESGGIEVFRVY